MIRTLVYFSLGANDLDSVEFLKQCSFLFISRVSEIISIVQKYFWDLKVDKITFEMGIYILYSCEICVVTSEKVKAKKV